MDFTLNELSLIKLDCKEKTINIFMELTNVASVLYTFGFKTMKIWDKGHREGSS